MWQLHSYWSGNSDSYSYANTYCHFNASRDGDADGDGDANPNGNSDSRRRSTLRRRPFYRLYRPGRKPRGRYVRRSMEEHKLRN